MIKTNFEELISCIDDAGDAPADEQIEKVIPRINGQGKRSGHLAVLADGTEIPIRDKPKPRAEKTGPAASFSMNAVVRAMAIIDSPEAYTGLLEIRLGTDPIKGGGPSTYPRALWSMMHQLQNAICTQRGLVQYLSLNVVLNVVIAHITALRDEASIEDQIVIDRWLNSRRKIPSEAHVSRMLGSLGERGFDAQ